MLRRTNSLDRRDHHRFTLLRCPFLAILPHKRTGFLSRRTQAGAWRRRRQILAAAYGSGPAWESVPAGVHEVYGRRVRQIGQAEERRIGCQGSHPIELSVSRFGGK